MSDTITSWPDLFMNEYKKRGYTVVTDFTRSQWFGLNDKKKLYKATQSKEDKYLSINGCSFGSRKSEDVLQLRNIAIDLDQYKLGLSIDDVLQALEEMASEEVIPTPNLISYSRGVQIFYSIDGGAAPELAWLTEYITSQYISKLKEYGADPACKGVTRVMRVPGSINSRNNAVVKSEIWKPSHYPLEELQSYCRPLDKFRNPRKKKNNVVNVRKFDKNLTGFYQINYTRIRDLERLLEMRGGDMTHKRDLFLYLYAFHRSLFHNSKEDTFYHTETTLSRMYSKDRKPYTQAELKKTVSSAFDDAEKFFEHFQSHNYRVVNRMNDGIIKPKKAETIIEELEITVDEQHQLRAIINAEIRKERDRKRKEQKRRSEGAIQRDLYLQKSRSEGKSLQIERLHKEGYKQKEIAGMVGVSKVRVSQVVKRMKEEIQNGQSHSGVV